MVFIPWGRVGTMAEEVKRGLLVEAEESPRRETAQYAKPQLVGRFGSRKWFVMLSLIAMVLVLALILQRVLY